MDSDIIDQLLYFKFWCSLVLNLDVCSGCINSEFTKFTPGTREAVLMLGKYTSKRIN